MAHAQKAPPEWRVAQRVFALSKVPQDQARKVPISSPGRERELFDWCTHRSLGEVLPVQPVFPARRETFNDAAEGIKANQTCTAKMLGVLQAISKPIRPMCWSISTQLLAKASHHSGYSCLCSSGRTGGRLFPAWPPAARSKTPGNPRRTLGGYRNCQLLQDGKKTTQPSAGRASMRSARGRAPLILISSIQSSSKSISPFPSSGSRHREQLRTLPQ